MQRLLPCEFWLRRIWHNPSPPYSVLPLELETIPLVSPEHCCCYSNKAVLRTLLCSDWLSGHHSSWTSPHICPWYHAYRWFHLYIMDRSVETLGETRVSPPSWPGDPSDSLEQCLSTCGTRPLWRSDDVFTRAPYQIFTLQFITAAKLQLWSNNENNFVVGVTTILKSHSVRKVESHCPRQRWLDCPTCGHF